VSGAFSHGTFPEYSLGRSAELFAQAFAPLVARFGLGVCGTWNMKDRDEHDEDDEGPHDVLSQIPDRFIVAEEELDGAVHAEYCSKRGRWC